MPHSWALGSSPICATRAEDELASGERRLPAESTRTAERRWDSLNEALKTFLGDKAATCSTQPQGGRELAEEIRAGAPTARVLDRLASWWLGGCERPLTRLSRYAVALRPIGKGEIEVEIEPHGCAWRPRPGPASDRSGSPSCAMRWIMAWRRLPARASG